MQIEGSLIWSAWTDPGDDVVDFHRRCGSMLEIMNFIHKTMEFVLKMVHFVLTIMNFKVHFWASSSW